MLGETANQHSFPETELPESQTTEPVYMRDVVQHTDGTHAQFTADSMVDFVDLPVLPACQQLFKLGITTNMSGADPHHSRATITIVGDSLDQRNRAVATQLVTEGLAVKVNDTHFTLVIPTKPDDKVKDVQQRMLGIVNRFHYQEKGAGAYSIEDLREVSRYSRNDSSHDHEVLAWEGFHHDAVTGFYYVSQEQYDAAVARREEFDAARTQATEPKEF